MTSVHRTALVTEGEFLALPETNQLMELLDGEIVMAPSPSIRHQNIVFALGYALETWRRGATIEAFIGHAPLDVHFGPSRILQPDLFVILGEVDRHRAGPIDQVPDLCVEVCSRDRVYDRVTKRYVYAEAGVREYWLVDTARPLLVERWQGPGLTDHDLVTGQLTSPLLPGFSLDVPSLEDR